MIAKVELTAIERIQNRHGIDRRGRERREAVVCETQCAANGNDVLSVDTS